MFTTVEAFQDMETDRYSKPSFESPHNTVHDVVGCSNGTMYDLNWAGFDPIFMLHHANVDRLISLWQAIYPNSSIFDIVDYEDAIYGTAAGNVSANSPLKPFYQTGGNFFTSNTVKDISTFGYSYPELQPTGANGSVSPDELSGYVTSQVNALYSDSSISSGARKPKYRRGGRGGSVGAYPRSGDAQRSTTWSVALQVDKAQVPLPATVGIDLGGQTVGKMALLAIPATGVAHSTINLDRALRAADMNLTNQAAVRDYLSQNMQACLQTVSDTFAFLSESGYCHDESALDTNSVSQSTGSRVIYLESR